MKALWTSSAAILLVTCVLGCAVAKRTVPEASIDAFFEIVERRDYHEMVRAGKEVFVEGHTIRRHARRFAGFPSSAPRPGQIRYVLYEFQGDASAGQVYLVLERDSGRIVEFSSFEAWFEPAASEGDAIPPDAIATPPVSVSTDKPVYGTGDAIVVTIENNLDGPIRYYDACSLRRCGYQDGEWSCIWKECHGETLTLAPGRSVEMRTGAKGDLGTRQAFEFDCLIVSQNTPYTARSKAFRVE